MNKLINTVLIGIVIGAVISGVNSLASFQDTMNHVNKKHAPQCKFVIVDDMGNNETITDDCEVN